LVPKALEETGEQRDEAPNLIQMQEHLVAILTFEKKVTFDGCTLWIQGQ